MIRIPFSPYSVEHARCPARFPGVRLLRHMNADIPGFQSWPSLLTSPELSQLVSVAVVVPDYQSCSRTNVRLLAIVSYPASADSLSQGGR